MHLSDMRLVGGVVFIVLLLAALSMVALQLPPRVAVPTPTLTPSMQPAITALPTLVSAPFLANTIVAAESHTDTSLHFSVVSIATPGYLVVREMKHDTPGAVIAVSPLLPAHSEQPLILQTSRPIHYGDFFMASLHQDTGTGKFTNVTTNPIMKRDDGNPAQISFRYEENND